MLTTFAQECQKYLRTEDIFGRIGGDEFAILLVAGAARARAIAERLRDVIMNLQIQLPEDVVSITVSLGIASTDHAKRTVKLENLVRLADEAMYRAKQGGKNKVEI
ncbi:MAG: GGDEF domain-containing protein [Chloroflexota bacterium]